jgi:hypothetical protein
MTNQSLNERAFARVELGITAAEWMDLTPVEWDAIYSAWKNKREREMRRDASMKEHLANLLSTRKDGRPWMVEDFLPAPPANPPDPDKIMRGFERAFD